MNKIEGLNMLQEFGLPIYNYIIYKDNVDLDYLNDNSRYILRKSLKNNTGAVSLGVDRNLTYNELVSRINELKDKFNLIILKEVAITYYGIVSRFISSNMDILAIEIFDTLDNRIAGIPCDRLEYGYIDNELIIRRAIPKSNVFKYVMYDLEKIDYREFQLEFITSNKDILYTDFDIIERVKKYEKHLF